MPNDPMPNLVARANGKGQNQKAMRIIARSLFKELKQNGYDSSEIVTLSSELISLVTSDLRAPSTSASSTLS